MANVSAKIRADYTAAAHRHRVTIDPALVALEQSVIGGILISELSAQRGLIEQIELTSHDFADYRCRKLFDTMSKLCADGVPIDVVTVEAELTRDGSIDAVGLVFIAECAMRVPTPDNAIEYASQIRNAALARRVVTVMSEVVEVGRQNLMEGGALLSFALEKLSTIDVEQTDETKTIGEVAQIRVEQLAELVRAREAGEPVITGALTGVRALDEKTGGYPFGLLSLVAARPGMGKSALLLAGVQANAAAGVGCHVFSMEDSLAAYADRVLAQRAHLYASQLRRADITREQLYQLQEAAAHYRRLPGWLFDERAGITAEEVIRSVRRHKRKINTRAVWIDYATLLGYAGDVKNERDQDMLKRSALAFQRAAKNDGIAYILASQLNRKVEDRPDKRPLMSDLRGAGELEEYCKFMIGLYRGYYYAQQSGANPVRNVDYDCVVCDQSMRECLHAPTDEEWSRMIQLLVLKGGNGGTGVVHASFDGPTVSIW